MNPRQTVLLSTSNQVASVNSACRGLLILPHFAAPISTANEDGLPVRVLFLLCVAALLVPAGGCALWDRSTWDLSKYRDERASDIDQRLSKTKPIVQNPF